MNALWIGVLGTSAIAFTLKYLGHSIPEKYLTNPRMLRINTLIPIALLSALVGVQTITESGIPDVASGIQTHVASMHTRVREQRGIHLRDPLFREVFQHADKISIEITNTDKGVHVTETSDDPHVVALVQAHADVVSRFIEHGHDEVRRNHAVPSQAQ